MDRRISMLTPFRLNRADIRLISFCCQGIARLKPGVSLTQANADVARMLPMAPEKFPMNPGFSANAFTDARIGPHLRLLKDALIGDIGNTLWVLMGTVGHRAADRLRQRREFAAGARRSAAAGAGSSRGARRWHGRIAWELLLESLLLGVTGGALGLALAYGALRLLVVSGLGTLPRLHEISIDPIGARCLLSAFRSPPVCSSA